ncbi:MAG TPA: hypothetical protein VNO31_03365 [Umezawaea sp.]|nr:hypothetical protein [Umezawaea sp.]
MGTRNTSGPLSVHAIAGSYVVLLGLDLAKRSSRGLLGFAIERWDPKERERYWLRGMKLFEETPKGVPPGTPVSLLEHCACRKPRPCRLSLCLPKTMSVLVR